MDTAKAAQTLRIGDWLVDGPGNRLWRDGEERYLRHKAMAVLLLLARHAGETVSRETLVAEVWDGNDYVANKAINNAVWSIRQALGDAAETPAYLETIPKKGYRLIAPVSLPTLAEPAPAPAAPRPRRAAWALVALALALALAAALWRAGGGAPPLAYGPPEPLTETPGLEYLGQLSPDGRQLAFAWWRSSGDGRLYLRAAGDRGAEARELSGDSGEVTGLAWAPDGQSLAYAAIRSPNRCALWLYSLRTAQRRILSDCHALWTPTLAWSPDGQSLAFSGKDGDKPGGLFLIAPDGSDRRQLTRNDSPSQVDHQPAWSPDGRRIAFARHNAGEATRDLYETDLQGRVTRLSAERLYSLHGLSYGANGQDLIYATTRQGARTLLVWERASGASRPLGLEGSAPQIGADGTLVYALLRNHRSLGRVALDSGTAPARLVRSVISDSAPSFSALRRQLAFVSSRGGHAEIWLADAEGGSAKALTRLQGVADVPAWSPDGMHIAFLGSCGAEASYGLCLVDVDSGAVRALAADGHAYSSPAWSPDGRELWLASDRGGTWQLWHIALAGGASTVATQEPPGRVQLSASGLVHYSPRFADHIKRLDPASGTETLAWGAADGGRLANWRIQGEDLLLLLRDREERIERLAKETGARRVLGRYPLGSFGEFARFDGDGNSLYIELADVHVADLMRAKPLRLGSATY